MLSWYQRNIRKSADPILIGNNIAKLDKRMTPVPAFERMMHEVIEPLAFKYLLCVLILLAVSLADDKGFEKRLSLSLRDTSCKVQINEGVGINVVQGRAVGIVNADCLLPSSAPFCDILLCQVLCLLSEHCEQVLSLLGAAVPCVQFPGSEP